ncbi:hypothetical protein GCM10023321_60520 [Pseudonocardia eucalypti]|uniref:TauD/TfdA-like domain-containing protein n=1 Tax=Pseudonocardia eucalypti TaxID=648755 RepID=A0ABP9QU76_9PSEU|nr:alpha-ketoglutarate-dependent taurine dioxygenase [Pseudonocardia eucalypti]
MSTGLADTPTSAVDEINSIAEVTNDQWAIETDAIKAALTEYFGADLAGSEMVPPNDPAELRARLRAAAPQLTGLTDHVRELFAGGACGILYSKLGLAQLDVDDQRKVIYALSALLGDVVWTHPVDNRVVWDVRNQEMTGSPGPKHSSFSENDREAEYHTDASYSSFPDRYFLLYSTRAAECGGGETFLTDGRVLKRELERTEEGRAAVQVLSKTRLPMRVPKAFRKGATVDEAGYSHDLILGESPMWKFRKDKIENGLAKFPEHATPEVRSALDVLYREMDGHADEFCAAIPTDAVLIVDNHLALHGRTGFTDSRRHLLRARFHAAPAS